MGIDKGLLAAIIAPIFIAMSVIFVNQIGSSQNPIVVAGYSQLISIFILLPLLLLKKEKLEFRKILTSLRAPLAHVVISRALLGNVLLTMGFILTTGVKSILLLRLEPVFVFIWSIFLLRERPTLAKFALIGLLVVGSAFVIMPGKDLSSFNYGDLAIMGGLLFLSYSYIPASRVSKEASPFGLVVLVNMIGGSLILLVSLVVFPLESFVMPAWSVLMMLGSIVTFYVIGLPLSFYAFKTVKPWIVSSLLSLEPLAGLFIAVMLVGESLASLQILGAAVILVSTYLIAKLR